MVLLPQAEALGAEASEYVSKELMPALLPALVTLCRERPEDPVTALAQLLLSLKPAKEPVPVATPASKLTLLHFNDVYNCETPKKAGKAGGAPRFISAIKSAAAAAPIDGTRCSDRTRGDEQCIAN